MCCLWKRACATLAVLLCFALHLNASPQPSELDGRWFVEIIAAKGNAQAVRPKSIIFDFKETEVTAIGLVGPEPITFAYVLDTSTTPRRFDYSLKGTTIEAVYSKTGDTLKIAIPFPGGARPSGLDAPDAIVYTLRRGNDR